MILIDTDHATNLKYPEIKRFAKALIDGVPVRDKDRPGGDGDLLEWLRQCRRAGLYEQGKAIYEKGGLNSANLTDEQQIEAEDDYRICARRGSTEEAKPKRKSRFICPPFHQWSTIGISGMTMSTKPKDTLSSPCSRAYRGSHLLRSSDFGHRTTPGKS